MSWLYRHLLRPVLFTQNAERIHNRTMRLLGWTSRCSPLCGAMHSVFGAPEMPTDVFGLHFPNPVGLAAGMDKQAEALPAWQALGFGFTELGAVTWHPQPGNPPPRIFRSIPTQAIVNRMGFNNPGAQVVAQVLADWRARGNWPAHPVGMNLGKSKVTPLDKALEDYASSFRVLRPHLDFFVINVSSPNTPNLRQLQDKAALDEILAAMNEVQTSGAAAATPPKPILVKVAPDLTLEALDEILELVGPRHIAGIVATNTTISRPPTDNPLVRWAYEQAGGLSGQPLKTMSTEIIRHLYRQTRGALPIIGVGGIFNAEDAWEKITAGASLLQIYTGFIYEGPRTVRALVSGLDKRLLQNGFKTLAEAVGSAQK
jgi:dihydroorotate dehydrogenase